MANLKLLVVEDDASTVKLYDRALPDELFDKRFATNGQEGLDMYKEWSPQIILLDIGLPVLTGYNVLREIRETCEDKDVVIIMVSSLSTKEDIMDCLKIGIEGYIVKPFDLKELPGLVVEYYKKKQKKS